jgi:hypothetical protein
MRGASEKRLAIAFQQRAARCTNGGSPTAGEYWRQQARSAYESARDAYSEAVVVQPTNHWAITQVVAIVATPMLMADAHVMAKIRDRYSSWWSAARQIAQWQLRGAVGVDRAWALGTLAELELLTSVYGESASNSSAACESVARICGELVETVGPDAFAVLSTRRQMQRYLNVWTDSRWTNIAKAAVEALSAGV